MNCRTLSYYIMWRRESLAMGKPPHSQWPEYRELLVLLSGSVMSDSLPPCYLQCDKLHCSLLTQRVRSNSFPLSQLCCPTILSSATPFSFYPQSPSIRVSSNGSALHIRWPKYWNFSLSISPSSEYSGLILFRMDWFHLLAVQGILKSLLQHHSSKASILWHSAFSMAQHSYPYMTTGKTIPLTLWTLSAK